MPAFRPVAHVLSLIWTQWNEMVDVIRGPSAGTEMQPTLPTLRGWQPDLAAGACGRCSAYIIRSPPPLPWPQPPPPSSPTRRHWPRRSLKHWPTLHTAHSAEPVNFVSRDHSYPRYFCASSPHFIPASHSQIFLKISCKKWLWNPTLSFFHFSLFYLSLWPLPHLFVYWFIFCLPGREQKRH